MNIESMRKKAKTLRGQLIKLVEKTGVGHLGGSLSIVEILIILYYKIMNIDLEDPDNLDNDTLILSKGHAAPILYLILADLGFFPKKELLSFGFPGALLQTHPTVATPGISFPSGSLGQGLSAGLGIALANRRFKRDNRVYVILGDGELNEGQVWEAVMAAAHYKLNNLIVMVDNNGFQLDGAIDEVLKTPSFSGLFEQYGWNTQTVDGHDFDALNTAIRNTYQNEGIPNVIICKTVKGKGVSFMENNNDFHSHYNATEEYEAALAEVGDYSLE